MFIKSINTQPEPHEIKINIDQISYIDDGTVFMSNGKTLLLSVKSLSELDQHMFPTKRTKKDNEPKSELLELFEQLHKLTGGKGNTVFTLGREKKLGELMSKHRLTRENLITAATNIGQDAFLQGANENKKRYGDIDYLLRPDKAAKWSEEMLQKKKSMF